MDFNLKIIICISRIGNCISRHRVAEPSNHKCLNPHKSISVIPLDKHLNDRISNSRQKCNSGSQMEITLFGGSKFSISSGGKLPIRIKSKYSGFIVIGNFCESGGGKRYRISV